MSSKTDRSSANEDSDAQARALIDQFASALRDLAEGKDIPKTWREYLKKAIALKRGVPKDPVIEERDLKIAHQMLLHQFAIDAKRTSKPLWRYAEELADEFFSENDMEKPRDYRQVLRIYRHRVADAMVLELSHLLDEASEAEQQAQHERVQHMLQHGRPLEDEPNDD